MYCMDGDECVNYFDYDNYYTMQIYTTLSQCALNTCNIYWIINYFKIKKDQLSILENR
jgi:hypothetical protein